MANIGKVRGWRSDLEVATTRYHAKELSKRAGMSQRPLTLEAQTKVWVFAYVRTGGNDGGMVGLYGISWEEMGI